MSTPNTTQTPAGGTTGKKRLLDIDEVCDELGVHRRTLYDWWGRNVGPRRVKLPNGKVRVRADWLEDFVLQLEVGGAA